VHQEFGGRHDCVMAQHADTGHPHVHLTVRTVGHDGIKLNLRKADLQHLRDVFAEKLRHRGIEAESTPRYARGVTRKAERLPVYKTRKRGVTPYVDLAKRREVCRDVEDNNGKLPDRAWDSAIVDRRNRVMGVYGAAALELSRSPNPSDRSLACDIEAFCGRLTDVTTQRAALARDGGFGRYAVSPGKVRSQSRTVEKRVDRDVHREASQDHRKPSRER
jgi:hypothetical protein